MASPHTQLFHEEPFTLSPSISTDPHKLTRWSRAPAFMLLSYTGLASPPLPCAPWPERRARSRATPFLRTRFGELAWTE